MSSARYVLLTLLLPVMGCAADPTVVLAPVPAGWAFGSLECVGELLGNLGYDVTISPVDQNVLDAQRSEGALGTGAHRERIKVRLAADTTGPFLRASVWAVDYLEAGATLRQTATINAPSTDTVADAQTAMEQCSRAAIR